MRRFILTSVRILRDFLISILLWTYAGLVVFTWHVAHLTPDWAVLLRVAASILNDLVWAPLGIIAWGAAAHSLLRIFRGKGRVLYSDAAGCAAAAILFHLISPDVAFRLLFLPLLTVTAMTVRNLFSPRGEPHLIGRIVPLALVALLCTGHYRFQMIPQKTEAVSGTTLKVMSYNIFLNGGREDRRRVIDTILTTNPDVVCCIEFNVQGDRALFDRGLGALYPYALASDAPKNSKSGAIIYSKYPMMRKVIPDSSIWKNGWEGRVSVIFAELEVNGRRVNLINYHLKSVGHYIEYIADKKQFTLREKIIWAAKYEEKNDHEKFAQAASLVETASSFPGPTILCGDLNDTPNSRAFLTILRRYRNTFSEKGWGLGATFGEHRIREKLALIPFVPLLARDVLRIDHIFVSRDLKVVSSSVLGKTRGSDHKPVVSVINISKPDM